MARIPRGGRISMEQAKDAAEKSAFGVLALGVPVSPDTTDFHRFGFLFDDLQADAHLLPVTPETVGNLIRLGHAMQELSSQPDVGDGGDAAIPAAYTYLGQFIDHDITRAARSRKAPAHHRPQVKGENNNDSVRVGGVLFDSGQSTY